MQVIILTQSIIDNILKPKEVKDHTTFESIQSLDDEIIKREITRSIRYLESSAYLGERLLGMSATQDMLHDLKMAINDLTVSFLVKKTDEKLAKGFRSERLSNYSYTLSDNASANDFGVDIMFLLEDFMRLNGLVKSKGNVRVSVI